MEIEELRKEYLSLEKKYKLPSFQELNENFEIGKVDRDVGALLRAIRKAMMEKIVNSMSFVEMLLNPMHAPRMYHLYIRTMSAEDKKSIDKIYDEFSNISMLSLEREIDYSEKEEAELIKKVFAVWSNLKSEFRKILVNMKKPTDNSVKKERSYFG